MNKKYIMTILIIIVVALIIFYTFYKFIRFKNNDIDINDSNISTVLDETKIINEEKVIEKNEIPKKEKVALELSHAKVPTLMYHSITDDMTYIEYPINAVSPIDFENQLKYIKENNYQTLFFTDLEKLENYTKPIILTFDDGFIDFYNEAFPLLKKYNQKATLFIIVGYINCQNYCTLEQLKEMESSGLVDVQVHTLSHKSLTLLSQEELDNEVIKSKTLLKEYLDKEVTALCYPYGSYNKSVSNLVSNYYSYAITMDEGCYDISLNTKQEIPRYTIPRGISIDKYINYISNSTVEVINKE